MANSPALDAAITAYRSARGALTTAENALRTQQDQYSTAVAAVRALSGASTNTEIGDAVKSLATEQSDVRVALANVTAGRDALAAARQAVIAQARLDLGLPPDSFPEGLS